MSFGKKHERITLIHMKKPIALGLVGMIQSPLFSENIALVIDSTPADERDYDFACLAYAAGVRYPRILMERELFYDVIRGAAEARTILFHEIGHYVNQDCANPDFSNESYRARRICTTEECLVTSFEAAADDFAVKYLGIEIVLKGLTHLLSRVKAMYENENFDADETRLVINELDMRISRIHAL